MARWALLAHLLALFLAVEELVEPADRLVVRPDNIQLRTVQLGQQFLERVVPRPEEARRVPAVEENLNLGSELIEQRLEVEPISEAVRKRIDSGGETDVLPVPRSRIRG